VDTGTTLPASLTTISGKIDTVDGIVDAIVVDTAEIGVAGAGLTEAGGTGDQLTAVPWNSSWDAEVQSEVDDALVAQKLDHLVAVADSDDAVDNSIIAKLASTTGDWSNFVDTTDSLQSIRDNMAGVDTAAIADAVWDEAASGHVGAGTFGAQCGTDIDAILTDTGTTIPATITTIDTVVDAILVDTGTTLPATLAGLNDIAASDVTGAEVDNDGTAISLAGALKLMLAVLTGKSSGGGTSTLVFRDIADTKNRISATVDSSGNRTAIGTRNAA